MSVFEAIVLGTIQGVTEFLPVSSSGHLIFFPTLFQWADQGIAFDVMVHLGTLVAVVVYFRKKLWALCCAFFSSSSHNTHERRLAWFIVLSMFPAGLVGYVLETNTRSAFIVAVNLILWGIVLGAADWYHHYRIRQGKSGAALEQMTPTQVGIIAVAQAIALIPGTSRSGITMTAGLLSGLSKKTAAEFSFLMSVPIIFVAGLVNIIDMIQVGTQGVSVSALLVGFIAAALSGFVAIFGLLRFIQKHGFWPFVVYRVIIGLLIMFMLV